MNNPGAWILGEVYRYIYSQLRVATDFKKILMVFSDGRVGMLSTLMPMICPPRRMALSQQQPLIPGVLHQPAVQKGKVKRIAREFRRS